MNASRAPYPPRPHANRETFRRGSAHRPEAGSPAGSRGLSAGLGGRRSGHSCSGISGCPRANSARSGRAGCPQDWPAGDSGHGRSGASSSPTANRLTSLARSRELPRGWMVGAAAMAARTAAAYGANSVRSARAQCPQDWVAGDSGQGRLGGSSSSRGELTDQPGLLARTAEGRMVGAAATVARTAAGLRGANSVRSARAEWPQDWVGSVGGRGRPKGSRLYGGEQPGPLARGRPRDRVIGVAIVVARMAEALREANSARSACAGCPADWAVGAAVTAARAAVGCPGANSARSGRAPAVRDWMVGAAVVIAWRAAGAGANSRSSRGNCQQEWLVDAAVTVGWMAAGCTGRTTRSGHRNRP